MASATVNLSITPLTGLIAWSGWFFVDFLTHAHDVTCSAFSLMPAEVRFQLCRGGPVSRHWAGFRTQQHARGGSRSSGCRCNLPQRSSVFCSALPSEACLRTFRLLLFVISLIFAWELGLLLTLLGGTPLGSDQLEKKWKCIYACQTLHC